MRVVLVNYVHRVEHRTPEELLADYVTLTGWAEGLAAAGAEVTVAQGYRHDARLERPPVSYRLVGGRFAGGLAPWRVPRRLHRVVAAERPDVVHLNGLLFPLQARDLRRRLPARCALVAQHHGERPRPGWRGVVERWGLAAVDGFLFTVPELAAPWRLPPGRPVLSVGEGSSRFRMEERAAARQRTGLTGDPVFLWAGNLDANKDPLTVLRGFELALATLPAARLYMAFRHDALLASVRCAIAASPDLVRSVTLLGRLPYPAMEAHLNSADFLLQGSSRECGGYAVVDALACGVVPVVTDIPTFRALTGGAVGELWPPGDAAALAGAIQRAAARPRQEGRLAARRRFEEALRFEEIGRTALAAYEELRRHARAVAGRSTGC